MGDKKIQATDDTRIFGGPIKSLFKAMISEAKGFFTPVRVLVALLLALMPFLFLLGLILNHPKMGDNLMKAWEKAYTLAMHKDPTLPPIDDAMRSAKLAELIADWSQSLITAGLSMVATFTIITRSITVLREKSTLDKNRASYLVFSRKQMLFAKFLNDVVLFSLSLVVTALSLGIYAASIAGSDFHISAAEIVSFVFATVAFYSLISYGLRLINSSTENKALKVWLLIFWYGVTVGLYICSSVGRSFGHYEDNLDSVSIIVAFIPLANITLNHSILIAQIDAWKVVPMIVENIIFFVVMWSYSSKKLKEYLCA